LQGKLIRTNHSTTNDKEYILFKIYIFIL
jgi:hypothetical protein